MLCHFDVVTWHLRFQSWPNGLHLSYSTALGSDPGTRDPGEIWSMLMMCSAFSWTVKRKMSKKRSLEMFSMVPLQKWITVVFFTVLICAYQCFAWLYCGDVSVVAMKCFFFFLHYMPASLRLLVPTSAPGITRCRYNTILTRLVVDKMPQKSSMKSKAPESPLVLKPICAAPFAGCQKCVERIWWDIVRSII